MSKPLNSGVLWLLRLPMWEQPPWENYQIEVFKIWRVLMVSRKAHQPSVDSTSKYRVKMLKTISNFISPKWSLHDDIRNYNFPCNSKTRMLLALPDRARIGQNAGTEPSVFNVFRALNVALFIEDPAEGSGVIQTAHCSVWSLTGVARGLFTSFCRAAPRTQQQSLQHCYHYYYHYYYHCVPATLSRCWTRVLFRGNTV